MRTDDNFALLGDRLLENAPSPRGFWYDTNGWIDDVRRLDSRYGLIRDVTGSYRTEGGFFWDKRSRIHLYDGRAVERDHNLYGFNGLFGHMTMTKGHVTR